LGAFVSDECVLDEKGFVLTAELYAVYKSWCDDNGERAISKKELVMRLQEMGFTPAPDRRGNRLWRGLRLAGRDGAKYR
jgi:phage/plasmid-associated DNA primase